MELLKYGSCKHNLLDMDHLSNSALMNDIKVKNNMEPLYLALIGKTTMNRSIWEEQQEKFKVGILKETEFMT